jgi:hypothetical protein
MAWVCDEWLGCEPMRPVIEYPVCTESILPRLNYFNKANLFLKTN